MPGVTFTSIHRHWTGLKSVTGQILQKFENWGGCKAQRRHETMQCICVLRILFIFATEPGDTARLELSVARNESAPK